MTGSARLGIRHTANVDRPIKDVSVRMRNAAAALAARFRESSATPHQKLELFATAALVALGIALRLRGTLFGPAIGMWTDEATWAMRLVDRPLTEHLIRPVGFMTLSRLSVAILGNTELGFRLVPLAFGVATPVVAALLARRLLTSPGARLLLVGVISLSSSAIDYSKEFKPYAIGVFFHLLLPLLALRWAASKRSRDLTIAGIGAALGLLFVQDVIFIYPGLFLVLAWEGWSQDRLRGLLRVCGWAASCAALVLAIYFLFWKRVPDGRDEYWGDKYGVFHRPKKARDSYIEWVSDKYLDMVRMPGDRRRYYANTVSARVKAEAQAADRLLWTVLHAAGIAAVLLRRRWREGLLLWSPLLVCGLFNLLGLWPFGAFRTNLFVLAGVAGLAALGIDGTRRPRWWRTLLPVSSFVLLPLIVFERTWHERKQQIASPDMRTIVERMVALAVSEGSIGEGLYLHHHAANPFKLYTRYHPALASLRAELERRFAPPIYKRAARDVFAAVRALPPGRHVWLIMTRQRGVLPKDLDVVAGFRRGEHDVYRIRTE